MRHPLLAAALAASLALAGCGRGEPAATPASEQRGLVVVDPSQAEVPPLHPSVDDYPEATVALTHHPTQRSVPVAVKVAHTAAQRQHGLMEVEQLPDGTGMLFLFASDRSGGFWMKDTRVPLDIAWATADGRIVDVQTMQPCEADPCPTYAPDAPYRSALEVPAGWFAEVGVDEQWRLELPDDLPAPE